MSERLLHATTMMRATGCALAMTLGLMAADANARVITVLESEHTIQHSSGFGSPPISSGFGPAPITSTTPIVEYQQTLNVGNNSSMALGGAGVITSSSKLGLSFPAGAGVMQDWVDAPVHDAAKLVIDFSVTWDMYAGFGGRWWSDPGLFGSRFFPFVSGNVSEEGWVSFSYTADFTAFPGGETPGTLSGSYFNDEPGAFSFEEVFDGNKVAARVPRDSTIELVGQMTFEAYDGSSEGSSSIEYTGSDTGGIIATPVPAALPLLAGALGFLAIMGSRRQA